MLGYLQRRYSTTNKKFFEYKPKLLKTIDTNKNELRPKKAQ